jgi:hypothetical protein
MAVEKACFNRSFSSFRGLRTKLNLEEWSMVSYEVHAFMTVDLLKEVCRCGDIDSGDLEKSNLCFYRA